MFTFVDVGDCFLSGGGQSWGPEEEHHSSYRSVLNLLSAKASAAPVPAAGTYGPYTVTGAAYDGTPYTISFSAAKVEKKTVQMREYYDIDGDYSEYQNKTVTFVTIKPNTSVTISGPETMAAVIGVAEEGNNRYTKEIIGAPADIHSGIGWGAVTASHNHVLLDWEPAIGPCMITIDTNTPSSFTDVKPGAYYTDAVKWAVDKKITSGTSDSTFSPDQICSVAEILIFLWRANGSPEPTGTNPFTDIKPADYYYKAALWAAEKGLVSGSTFGANTDCTRASTMEYMWKAAGSPVPSGEASFNDVPANADYAQAVTWGRKGSYQRHRRRQFLPRLHLYPRADCHVPAPRYGLINPAYFSA